MRGVAEHYHNTYGETDKNFKVIATEMEFLVKLDEDLFMTGTIDLVYEVDGKIRFMDHKTVSSISMYEEKAVMDRQISRYWWALKMIAAGIGRVKDKENDVWVTSQALKDKTMMVLIIT
jgi:ATP-dependent exoDNAse (exonuclease V) beta subunit